LIRKWFRLTHTASAGLPPLVSAADDAELLLQQQGLQQGQVMHDYHIDVGQGRQGRQDTSGAGVIHQGGAGAGAGMGEGEGVVSGGVAWARDPAVPSLALDCMQAEYTSHNKVRC